MPAGEVLLLGFQLFCGFLTVRFCSEVSPFKRRAPAGLGYILPTLVLLGEISLPQHSNPDPCQSHMLFFVLPQGRRDRRCQAVRDLCEAGGD